MSLANFFVAAGHTFSDWRKRHNAYTELMALDDRTLSDIGVRRSEIAGLVYGQTEPVEMPKPVNVQRSRPAVHKAA